jgi:hypothetical protein
MHASRPRRARESPTVRTYFAEITSLHHTIDTGIAHDVIIDAWWTSL